eukprot:s627_g43.t1
MRISQAAGDMERLLSGHVKYVKSSVAMTFDERCRAYQVGLTSPGHSLDWYFSSRVRAAPSTQPFTGQDELPPCLDPAFDWDPQDARQKRPERFRAFHDQLHHQD